MDFSLRSFLFDLHVHVIIPFPLCVALFCFVRSFNNGLGLGGHLANTNSEVEWLYQITANQGVLLKRVQDPPISTKVVILDLHFVANYLNHSRHHFMPPKANGAGAGVGLESSVEELESQLKSDIVFHHPTATAASCCSIDYRITLLLLSHRAKFEDETLLPQKLQASLPLKRFFVSNIEFYGLITRCERDAGTASLKIRLALPLRPTKLYMKIYQVQFVQFLANKSVCGLPEAMQNPQPILVLVQYGGLVYRIPPGICGSATCHIPPELNRKHFFRGAAASIDYCLTAIFKDNSPALIESLCHVQCEPLTNGHTGGGAPYRILFGPTFIRSNRTTEFKGPAWAVLEEEAEELKLKEINCRREMLISRIGFYVCIAWTLYELDTLVKIAMRTALPPPRRSG